METAMEDSLKKLPLGIQTFKRIANEKRLYADKTAYLAKLIDGNANVWFLSRPRRFGKSLTVSVL
jgi:hypothetical protein